MFEAGLYQQALEASQAHLAIAQAAQSLAEDLQHENIDLLGIEIVRAYIGMGRASEAEGNAPLAIESMQLALAQLEQIKDIIRPEIQGVFSTNQNIALVYLRISHESLSDEYREEGNYELALETLYQGLEHTQQQLEIARASGNEEQERDALRGIASTYGAIKSIHFSQNQYLDEIAAIQEILSIASQIGDRAMKMTHLSSLGGTYFILGEYSEALKYRQQALGIAKEIQDLRQEALDLIGIGHIHKALGEYAVAQERYEEALAIVQDSGKLDEVVRALNALGGIYAEKAQYPQALAYFEEALAITQDSIQRLQQPDAFDYLPEACLNSDLSSQENDENSSVFQADLDRSLREFLIETCSQRFRSAKSSILNNIGIIQENQGNYPEALDYYNQSLLTDREMGDRRGEASNLNNISGVYMEQGNYEQALVSYQQSLVINQDIGYRSGEAATLGNIGVVYSSRGDYSKALEYHQQALVIAQNIGDPSSEATTFGNIGTVYLNQGNYQLALEFVQKALSIHQRISDHPGEATNLNAIGSIYQSQGNYPEALDYYQRSLSNSQELGLRSKEIATLINIGTLYDAQSNYSQALSHSMQALELAEEIDAVDSISFILNNIGGIYSRWNDYSNALDYYRKSLALNTRMGRLSGQSTNLSNIGLIYADQANYSQALDYYSQSLSIEQDIGKLQGETISLGNIGYVYYAQGDYPNALEYFQQALDIAQDIGDRAREANAYNSFGVIYSDLGQYSQATAYYNQALSISNEIGNQDLEGTVLNGLGSVYQNQEDYETALEYHQKALKIAQSIGGLLSEVAALGNIGRAYIYQSQYSEALKFYQQALTITEQIGTLAEQGIMHDSIGVVYRQQGDYPQALESHQKSLTIAREIGNRAGVANTLGNIGIALLLDDQFSQAESTLYEALTIAESLRPSELSENDRISLSDTQTGTYKYLQRLLIAQNNIPAALQIAERGRARVLAETLTTRLSNPDSITNLDAPDIATIQRIAQQQNATLVQYSIIDPRIGDPALYIWVISPTGTINFQQVALNTLQRPLDELVNTGRTAIGVRGRNNATITQELTPEAQQRQQQQQQQALQQLHQLLIEPIAAYLPTNESDRIVFIPQGDLFLVPFPALMDANGDYLIKRHTLLTAPSIQVLDLTQQQRGRTRNNSSAEVLVVGNPTPMPSLPTLPGETAEPLSYLAGALEEAIAIGDLLQVAPLIEVDATKASVVERMPQARIIHLATHGLLDYGIPGESVVRDIPGAIALAPSNNDDSLLTSAEILQMNLNADLVVLSACDTGQGRITGDGVIGLSRAFITAGVPSVMVSLWAVDDAATAELMVTFYDQWQQTGDKAQALRQAMLTTMATNPEPRLWAAFTLIGEAE